METKAFVCTNMKAAIETILGSHGLLEAYQGGELAVRIRKEPFMPLSIERHGSQITVTHYFTQNGDLVPDPDMEFELIADTWHPVAIQLSTGHYRRAVEHHSGERLVYKREARNQVAFSSVWAKHLIDQGFASGEVERLL